MDIIIIGKATHNRNDTPHVVYCGTDRNEAAAAVAATAGKFLQLYEVSPEKMRPIASPPVPEQAQATPVPPPKGKTKQGAD